MSKVNLKPYKRKSRQGVPSHVLPDVNVTMLAAKAGVNRSHLSRVLNGHDKAGYRLLKGLMDAVGVSSIEQVERWLERVIGNC